MGNALTLGSASSMCSLKILPAATLTKSSLGRLPNKDKSPASTNYSLNHASGSKRMDFPSPKDLPDSPGSKKGNHSPFSQMEKQIALTENDFHILQVLRTETLGKVYLVKKDDDQKLYLVKTLDKRRMQNQRYCHCLNREKEVLESAHHPSIPKLKYTFENEKKIFLVMDYIQAERLEERLQSLTRFSEEITKFYAAEILTTLEYLYKELEVTYNNLKMENMFLDEDGHVIFSDFGKVKNITSGTSLQKEKKMIDFWQLGHLIYQLLTGKTMTYSEQDENSIRITSLKEENFKWPSSVSLTARDFVIRLLCPKFEERLGFNGIQEIKGHSFFTGIRWNKIEQRLVYPPISPSHSKKTIQEFDEEHQNENEPFDIMEPWEFDDILEKKQKCPTSEKIGKPYGLTFKNYNHWEI